jgi:hypothetical protein
MVLYGCETLSLTLKKKHRLEVFLNRMLRGIFRPKRNDLTGEWRKLHNEVLRDLYLLPSIIRMIKSGRMRRAVNIAGMWEKRNVYRLLL